MKNYKKIFIALAFFSLSVEVANAEVVSSGSCGDYLTWEITELGYGKHTLTISGIGEMWNFSPSNATWAALLNSIAITSVVINDGVTSIGNYAFDGFEFLESVSMSNSILYIRNGVFLNCIRLTEITIPASVALIQSSAFSGCISLDAINVDINNQNYSSENGVLLRHVK